MNDQTSTPNSRRAQAPAQTDQELARLAKALGHPARVAIMRMLLDGGACVCGRIVEGLPLAQATVSQHLKVLKEAGLVKGEVEGPKVCYCANPAALRRLIELASDLLAEPQPDTRRIES